MDWLTQRKEELFKDEGQDAKQTEKTGAWLSTLTGVKGKGDAARVGALKQNLDLAVGQSDTVPGNQPSPTGEARWDLREQLGMSAQKEEEIQESTCFMWQILSSFQVFFLLCIHQKRLCSAAGKSDPQISVASHTHTYTYIYTHIHKWTRTYILIYRHTHTHTLITTYGRLWSGRLLHMHHLEHAASGAGERERLESHTWAFPASTQRCHRRHRPRFPGHSESPGGGNAAVWRASLSIQVLQ